jgi:hypothetical protein
MTSRFDEVMARSRDGSPFSNGTEGDSWTANWCDRCLVDAPFRNGLKGATGCPILVVALCGRTPAEWLDGPRDEQGRYSMTDQYHCVEFRAPGGGGEPKPKPTPRDQGELFSREGHEGRRVLAPLHEDMPAAVTAP